jgi:eukaryotic-like serine/threonine-protein kinase
MIGKTLNHYQITNQLGKGGMGEVYQAKDRKLGREVAIKVLPDEFAKDADRVARFQREAKILASLNHPNIAAIYGLEESGGTNFLVLELVEGQTLANRMKAGPIPVEESLNLALQIAEALEAAHEKGVIHRDLKPANIKVTPEGKVKVLDFGLAKAFAGEQEQVNLSNSPTLSDMATQQGVILGTAAYMSPEQAKGKAVDKRTDIWAFGCVLYEMLTGQAAFQGEDVTEILASVVKAGVNLDLLPANIHPRVREVITRCLQKDQKKRYPEIGEAHYEIEKVLADPSGVFAQPVTTGKPRKKMRMGIPWVAAAVILTAVIASIAVWHLKPIPPPEPKRIMRFTYELPEGQEFNRDSNYNISLAISPDGSQFVYGTTQGLCLRSMDELGSKLIAGTGGGAEHPFFSPDGKWIGYFSVADRKMKKIGVNGGIPIVLCDAADFSGASWGEGDMIVYCTANNIMRISANGGTPESLAKGKSNYVFHPNILPDGKSILYCALDVGFIKPRVMLYSLKSGESKELFAGEAIRYLPTRQIVYGLPDTSNIAAIPFDLKRLEVAGGQVPMVQDVGEIAISDSGTLVYTPGSTLDTTQGYTLMWVDRKGKAEPLAAPANIYSFPKISPDGTRVALSVETGGNQDIWIWDIARKILTRLTFNKGIDRSPIWTLDGKRIAFVSYREGASSSVYWRAADGTGDDEKLGSVSGGRTVLSSWSADGKAMVFEDYREATQLASIGMLSIEGDRKWKPLLQDEYTQANPQISPDGRWMAYFSMESGKAEIYVRPFPKVNSGKWQVSFGGGQEPRWSPDGRELFYRNGDAMMAVAVETAPTFKAGLPKELFRGNYSSYYGHSWDIRPDGKKFLMIQPPASTQAAPTAAAPRPKINIVVNWFEELKQRVPTK